jgi:dihydroneopterin aldolase
VPKTIEIIPASIILSVSKDKEMAMEAVINLSGIKIKSRIGVGVEERSELQTLEIDACLTTNIREAIIYDDIAETVDYMEIIEKIQAVALDREYRLVETLAYEVCRDLLSNPKISAVRLKLTKHPALMEGKADSVSLELGPIMAAKI